MSVELSPVSIGRSEPSWPAKAGVPPAINLKVPSNTSLLPLPAYSPELNPVENVWEFLRGNSLSHCVWYSCEAILKAYHNAWNKLMARPEQIASLIRRSWAKPAIG